MDHKAIKLTVEYWKSVGNNVMKNIDLDQAVFGSLLANDTAPQMFSGFF
jgi:hypothetical protein